MEDVESFSLDHTKVSAPYVRKCASLYGKKGDIVEKYDIRFFTPNSEFLTTTAMHSVEHLMAVEIRRYLDDVIDFSPMGCRTGYYLSVFGNHSVSDIRKAVSNALTAAKEYKEVPAANAKQCGNYSDLSMEEAKKVIEKVLSQGFNLYE